MVLMHSVYLYVRPEVPFRRIRARLSDIEIEKDICSLWC